jgi:hypothetical protein
VLVSGIWGLRERSGEEKEKKKRMKIIFHEYMKVI